MTHAVTTLVVRVKRGKCKRFGNDSQDFRGNDQLKTRETLCSRTRVQRGVVGKKKEVEVSFIN